VAVPDWQAAAVREGRDPIPTDRRIRRHLARPGPGLAAVRRWCALGRL